MISALNCYHLTTGAHKFRRYTGKTADNVPSPSHGFSGDYFQQILSYKLFVFEKKKNNMAVTYIIEIRVIWILDLPRKILQVEQV